MSVNVNTRELALDMLMEILEKNQYSHLVLRAVLDKYAYLEKSDRAFLTRLTEGTIEKMLTLDFVINTYSKVKVRKQKPLIRNLLRLGTYQILFMDSVPDSAACNETVKLAKKRGFAQLSGFVNGVLRTIAREKDKIPYPNPEKEPLKALSIGSSIPEWILEEWQEAYGLEQTRKIAEAMGQEKGTWVRVNTAQISPQQLEEEMKKAGVSVKENPKLSYALCLWNYDSIANLPGYQEGLFYVQDVSSMMVADLASPKPGDYCIDVCAAPGGKSTHLAELLQGSGWVEARDLTDYKVGLIQENIDRHHLTNMSAVRMDARVKDPASQDKADLLICDLPCSGLGVMGKKTDIRYRMSLDQADQLAQLQREILSAVFEYVKAGGDLIYSTCTIRSRENEENLAWFLKEHPNFSMVSQQQYFPGQVGADGFFLAKLHRDK